MATREPKLAWKAITAVAGIAAGMATKKLLGTAWTRVTGLAPPDPPEHPDDALPVALTWAVLTGAAAAVAKVCLTRRAAVSWRSRIGALRRGLRRADAN